MGRPLPGLSGRHLTIAAAAVVAAGLAACGSSSSTGPSSSISLAAHFDTLVLNAQDSGHVDRSVLLTYPTAALAAGVRPSSVNLTVDGQSKAFQVVGIDLVTRSPATGAAVDSTYFVIAWSGANVDQLFYVQTSRIDGITQVEQLVDTVAVVDSAGSVSASLASTGAKCGIIDLTSTFDLLHGATCTSASIQASFTASFSATPGLTTQATRASLGTTGIPSARLVILPSRRP